VNRRHLLIVIVSALVLGAANPSPSPQPNPIAHAQAPAQQHSPAASPKAPTADKYERRLTAESNTTSIYNYYYDSRPSGNLAGWLEAGATLCLVIFAALQIGFLKRTTSATETAASAASQNAIAAKDAADAAKQNADAARLTLKSDRPYLLVEKAELAGFPPKTSMSIVVAKFTFRNYGKGPALIHEVVLKLKVVSERPAPRDFSGCKEWKATVDAVTPAERLVIPTDFVDGSIGEEDTTAVINGSKTLIAYGQLRYRDVFDNPYETGFFWVVNTFQNLHLLGMDVRSLPPSLYIDRNDSADKDRNYHA
jgi:hypothetical protein